MIRLTERIQACDGVAGELALDFDLRQKSRFRTVTMAGEDVGVFVERGSLLRNGDCLRSDDGRYFRVLAKAERLSVVRGSDSLELARAAYHLGNRHVKLQVSQGYLAYQPDHVLDQMVERLGLEVTHEELPFEPENGAYHGEGSHGHGHAAVHTHGSAHAHDHPHHHESADAHRHEHRNVFRSSHSDGKLSFRFQGSGASTPDDEVVG